YLCFYGRSAMKRGPRSGREIYRKLALIVVLIFLLGCRSVTIISDRDPATGKYTTHVIKGGPWRGYEWAAFEESVQTPLAKEKAGVSASYYGEETWAKYWISRCEGMNYEGNNTGIEYVIQQRREQGLPEIPEINSRSFRSPWQIFLDSENPMIDQEARGLPHP